MAATLPAGMLDQISSFSKDSLQHTETAVREECVSTVISKPGSGKTLSSPLQACHGQCYGFQDERAAWSAPLMVVECKADARPGYESMDASEYIDKPTTLAAKVKVLARLVRQARCCVVYSGAGLSTGAGIGDYASQAEGSLSGPGAPAPRASLLADIANRSGSAAATPTESKASFRSPLCAQPTLAHRALVAMHKAGMMHRWINQNHDGLPQKAGLPQQAINEIHGAWHAPDNPVVPMSGNLRDDLFSDMLACEGNADLSIAVGTSLCGMNADRVVTKAAERASQGASGQFGSVVIGLQRTVLDETATLRIFGRCDSVFAALAEELALDVAPPLPDGEFWSPAILEGRDESEYKFHNVSYDAAGKLSTSASSTLDLRDDTELVIPSGTHAGAVGVIDGMDREGNLRCRFKLKPKTGKLRAPVMMLLGRWWIQAAVDAAVPLLPVVNTPSDDDKSEAAEHLRALITQYAA